MIIPARQAVRIGEIQSLIVSARKQCLQSTFSDALFILSNDKFFVLLENTTRAKKKKVRYEMKFHTPVVGGWRLLVNDCFSDQVDSAGPEKAMCVKSVPKTNFILENDDEQISLDCTTTAEDCKLWVTDIFSVLLKK